MVFVPCCNSVQLDNIYPIKSMGYFVSIIIPAYNAGGTLARTCASVALQSYSHWECLIVDDGSTDSTKAIALEYAQTDSRFRYIYKKNQGVSEARNHGIGAAQGTLLAFLDADDLWLTHTLDALVAPFKDRAGLGLTWGNAERFTEHGKIKPVAWKNYHATGVPWYDMLVHDFMPIGSFCMHKDALPAPPYFDATITHGEDRDFLLRVLKNTPTIRVAETVLFIRQHASSASTKAEQAIESEIRSMQKHLEDKDIPAAVRKRALSALAFRCAIIAGFTGRDWLCALGWYFLALLRAPFNSNNYLLVLRKIRMTFFPPPR